MGARQDPLRNSKGQVTQAIFVFTNMLRKLLNDENLRLKKIIADQALQLERKNEELSRMNSLFRRR